jgi:hypothetical protein
MNAALVIMYISSSVAWLPATITDCCSIDHVSAIRLTAQTRREYVLVALCLDICSWILISVLVSKVRIKWAAWSAVMFTSVTFALLIFTLATFGIPAEENRTHLAVLVAEMLAYFVPCLILTAGVIFGQHQSRLMTEMKSSLESRTAVVRFLFHEIRVR